MKQFPKIMIACSLLLASVAAHAGVLLQFSFAGSTVQLLDSAGAATATAQSDAYTKALTPFDLQIRLGSSSATEKDYLAMAAKQARNWPAEEQQQIKKSYEELEAFLKQNNVKLSLPKEILMIKTAGKEEFGAEGYTRENRISLCTGPQQRIDLHLIAHELFHVYSRFNAAKRDELYAVFGFRKCNRLNTAAAMNGHMITNPDCPFIEHYIPLMVNDQQMDMVLQLYSRNDYKDSYTLGDYANLGLLRVSGMGADKKPVMKNGKGEVYELEQVPDFFAKIGTNTSYILHPEEIAAEHFAMWAISQKVPQPEFFDKMKAILLK